MAKQTKQEIAAARAVASDRGAESNFPASVGEVVSIYTTMRAWRGPLVGQTAEFFLLASPTIVWTSDSSNVNQNHSRYFVTGKEPQGHSEEPSGARIVCINKSDWVHATPHGVMADLSGLKLDGLVTQDGLPAIGSWVHASTVTHEFCGKVAELGDEHVKLVEASMVNNIDTGVFREVLAGTRMGTDHVKVAPVHIAIHACTAWVVR